MEQEIFIRLVVECSRHWPTVLSEETLQALAQEAHRAVKVFQQVQQEYDAEM